MLEVFLFTSSRFYLICELLKVEILIDQYRNMMNTGTEMLLSLCFERSSHNTVPVCTLASLYVMELSFSFLADLEHILTEHTQV